MNVLFVCVANSGRSVMAERLFREAAHGRHQARSAGSEPGRRRTRRWSRRCAKSGSTHPTMCRASSTQEALDWADVAVSTCSEEVCPVTPGVRRISWVFEDPKSLPLERVCELRDDIKKSVEQLLRELDAEATAA